MLDPSRDLDQLSETDASIRISPTDVSQFIRLDQCRRYLRLRLHERNIDSQFLEHYGVVTAAIPSILTSSGNDFELHIREEIEQRFDCHLFDRVESASNDNAAVLDTARDVRPGELTILFQPRLAQTLGNWALTGDLDVLRFERHESGALDILICDIKSSTAAAIEHRLQVAMYQRMLEPLLASSGIDATIRLGILYRGAAESDTLAGEDSVEESAERTNVRDLFGLDEGYLELVDNATAYLEAVDDLLLKPDAVSRRIVAQPFMEVPFHLTLKCDGCAFNEFCMKQCHESDNLSLIPFMSEQDKQSLERNGIRTTRQLADLKKLGTRQTGKKMIHVLKPTFATQKLADRLSNTWPLRDSLDGLIYRAHSVRHWRDNKHPKPGALMPNTGYSTLPASTTDINPNLVRVYVDAQHDYLNDRIYLLGARVVACDNGETSAERTRSVVRLAEGPPIRHEIERDLFMGWLEDVFKAIAEVVVPSADGSPTAPIHLIFNDATAQRFLIAGLGRHIESVLGTTALYDLMTQVSAFDSPVASLLMDQVRKHKNYPMTCQSLQSVAAYLGFDWRQPRDFRRLFATRLFDFWGKATPEDNLQATIGEQGWFLRRSRFNSQIPLEHAYTVWNEIPEDARPLSIQEFGDTSRDDLLAFEEHRLKAMELIANEFRGNSQLELTRYDLTHLIDFDARARSLANALEEFILIERHVEVAAWKAGRLPEPEQRMISGTGMVLQFEEADQDPETLATLKDFQQKEQLEATYREKFRTEHPDAKSVTLPKEQKEAVARSLKNVEFRFRVDAANSGTTAIDLINRTTIRPEQPYIFARRWELDSRSDPKDPRQYTPTAQQLMYGFRAELLRFEADPSKPDRQFAVVALDGAGAGSQPPFAFGGGSRPAISPHARYTLDPDINSWNGYWQWKTMLALQADGTNTLYAFLTGSSSADLEWTAENDAAQQRFMEGLDALRDAGDMHPFSTPQRSFISGHGADPVLLVQGPPGTGKSYNTAFALLARLQGAMATGRPYRVFVSCKTHAAIDVVINQLCSVQFQLGVALNRHPDIAARYFDPRILQVMLGRVRPKDGSLPDRVQILSRSNDRKQAKAAVEKIRGNEWCIVGVTPGNAYKLIEDGVGKEHLTTSELADCVVLDEASQMSIPEGILATLGLKPTGHLIVVGDHRQMPPIVHHDWQEEQGRTFRAFPAYESLFVTLNDRGVPTIRFEESFRLHRDIAEFLRQEVYEQDGIDYHSNKTDLLEARASTDEFVNAVLSPEHPLIVVVHDEASSQHMNDMERELMLPVLNALADPQGYALNSTKGMGVVVPHRAQRTSLIGASETLVTRDEHGQIVTSAVDTVERFQGSERDVVIVSATESDPSYILVAGDFLLDPRRLNVALSRAKKKIILVASRSVFDVLSANDETFRHAQLWKNLLRRTCTQLLWDGERETYHVEVWGNPPRN